MSQLRMMFAHVPCICFDDVAFNLPCIFFKQLELKKSDLMPNSCPNMSKRKKKSTKPTQKERLGRLFWLLQRRESLVE